MRRITGLVLLVLVALAAPAQAQTPTPTSAVAIELDPGPAGIPLGGSHDMPFQVKLTLSNIVCTQAAMATVALAVADKPSPLNGVKGTAPATVTFTIPQGNYGVASSPFEETADAALMINVTSESLPNHEHTFEVTGTFEGTLTGCQGAGPIPRAEGSAEHQIKTGPAPAQGAARGATQTQGTGTSGDGGSKDAPGLEAPILLAMAIGLVALRRRFHG